MGIQKPSRRGAETRMTRGLGRYAWAGVTSDADLHGLNAD